MIQRVTDGGAGGETGGGQAGGSGGQAGHIGMCHTRWCDTGGRRRPSMPTRIMADKKGIADPQREQSRIRDAEGHDGGKGHVLQEPDRTEVMAMRDRRAVRRATWRGGEGRR